MNLIGVRAHDYGRMKSKSLFANIARDSWQCVQLAFPKCIETVNRWEDITTDCVEHVQRELIVRGLSVAVLGCYVELGMADEVQRSAAVQVFCEQLQVAKLLNAGCIGTETTNMDKQPYVTRQEALQCLERSLAEILPRAENMGVTVAVEPVFYHVLNTPEATRRVLDDMASPALRVIFDPANLFSPAEACNQHAIWQRVFDSFGDKIEAVHIKGARIEGERTLSCPLKYSQVDYKSIFGLLSQSTSCPPLLREEAVPGQAAEDIAFLRGLLR